jgi:hypothetical protein
VLFLGSDRGSQGKNQKVFLLFFPMLCVEQLLSLPGTPDEPPHGAVHPDCVPEPARFREDSNGGKA